MFRAAGIPNLVYTPTHNPDARLMQNLFEEAPGMPLAPAGQARAGLQAQLIDTSDIRHFLLCRWMRSSNFVRTFTWESKRFVTAKNSKYRTENFYILARL